MIHIAPRSPILPLLLLPWLLSGQLLAAQAPQGPLPPPPGTQIQATPPQALAKITAHVALVSAPVTVRDKKGAMIHALDQQDFLITDNGVPQTILHFDVGGDPIWLVVLVETSSRVDPLIAQLRKTGVLFSEQIMGPNCEAAVIGFDSSVKTLQGFTRNHDAIEAAFSSLQTDEAAVHLFDAMSAGVEMLSGRGLNQESPMPGRRVLLVLSEALDTGSDTHLGEVLRRAQLENVTIFAVGLSTLRTELQNKPRDNAPVPITPPGTFGMPPPPGTVQTPTSDANQQNAGIDLIALTQVLVEHTKSAAAAHSLELGAAATGGGYYATFRGRSIENAIDEIGGELHSQYMISYVAKSHGGENADFGFHHISVALAGDKAKGKKITTRPGYYIAPPGS